MLSSKAEYPHVLDVSVTIQRLGRWYLTAEKPNASAPSMRFSLKTLFIITLAAAILLGVMRHPSFTRLSLAFHLLGFALWNVLAVAGLMYALGAVEWLLRQMRR